MKKYFRMLASASLAVAGILVSSCTTENISTTFEPTNAVATITVKVVDIANAGKDVSNLATITTDINNANVSISGNIITVTGTPAISELTFKAFAKLGDSKGETTIKVPAVLAGGKSDLAALISIGEIATNYETGEEAIVITKENSVSFYSTHGLHTYTHDYSVATHGHGVGSGEWLYNETEFILETTIEYESLTGFIPEKSELAYTANATENDKAAAKYFYDQLWESIGEPCLIRTTKHLDVKVSAFAMYSAFGTRLYAAETIPYLRVNSDGTKTHVADFTITMVGTMAEYCEAAVPGHEGHYHFGHGHGDIHGYSSNAGGGIMWAD